MIAGTGGGEMVTAGVDVLIESLEWGVIGYVEAYARLTIFALRFWTLVRLVRRYHPDLLILVDFPGMNRELVRHFSGRVPMVYFVPPQTAFRRGASAMRMARAAVRLLAVLPFEAEAYRRAGADVAFIGHPAVDVVRAPARSSEQLRAEWGITRGLVVGLLPGSRLQEIRRLCLPCSTPRARCPPATPSPGCSRSPLPFCEAGCNERCRSPVPRSVSSMGARST